MTSTKLDTVLRSVAQKMRADFEKTRAIQHRGEGGAAREEIVRSFLCNYAPRTVESIQGAEAVDVAGNVSQQIDVAMADASAIAMSMGNSFRLLFSESLRYAIEVKTKLNKTELSDSCEKIRSVKSLQKSAYGHSPWPSVKRYLHGRQYDYLPTGGAVFAFDSIDLLRLAGHFYSWCSGRSPAEVPDSVWVLGKGFLQWINPANGNIDAAPSPGARLGVYYTTPEVDVLLPFVLHLGIYLGSPVDLRRYSSSVLAVKSKQTSESPFSLESGVK